MSYAWRVIKDDAQRISTIPISCPPAGGGGGLHPGANAKSSPANAAVPCRARKRRPTRYQPTRHGGAQPDQLGRRDGGRASTCPLGAAELPERPAERIRR